MIALFCLQLAAALPAAPSPVVYNGRQGNTAVHSPRGTDAVTIDGRLDEPQWRSAALLTGFSLYQPLDGAPSPDSTEVLVWHSATALYVGVRAWEPHGDPRSTVHATLADRDKISGDDNIQLLLDTFDDKHRAFVFGVNPLGVQGDGIRSEGSGAGGAGGFTGFGTDLSSDFLYASSGHVTDFGYEVEIRIPFRALRFPAHRSQRWGINVIRTVQHSGYTETWTPVRRGSASFLAQSGSIDGLDDLQRDRVLVLNPEITARSTGSPSATAPQTGWSYTRAQDLGGNVKWDVNSALTLNGTVHPDFSQVEADAAQIATDPRFALFFPEKRPFFIDGLEQFDVPHQLVYTRRIAQPIGATKLTGTVGGTDVALLAAEDARSTSVSGLNRPSFLIARLRRDIAGRATLGLVYTDREDGATANRVLGMDARYLFGGLYYAQFQAVESQTRAAGGGSVYAPLWEAIVDRTGRNFGFHYQITGIADDFAASSGFVARTGFVKPSASNRFTVYGAPGALMENFTTRITVDGTWRYKDFSRANSVLEDHASIDNSFTLRGGWILALTPTLQTYAFDPAPYATYRVAGIRDTTPFVLPVRLTTANLKTGLTTPQYQHIAASASFTAGRDVDFSEVDAVQRRDGSLSIDWHPSQQLRMAASYQSSSLSRARDGVVVATARIPRVKTEYQVSRPIFVRLVAQYDARTRVPLTDYRSGAPIVTGSAGNYVPSIDQRTNAVRVDGLFSYQPAPGTVVFLGYGNSLTEPEPLAFDRLRR
ncbi:MAG: DUF5916 domain-containing protein, partial [bacterium]